MVEQVTQESGVAPVQKAKKKRSQAEKRGINRWTQVLQKRDDKKLDRVLDELRWVRHRFERIGEAEYEKSDVERWAVVDEVDREIIQRVREAGAPGVLPKDVAAAPALVKYGLKYYHVARRIVRMNKKLYFESGKLLFEKRGHKWALTSFGFDAWGDIERVS
jgi:hypothetical protein